MSTLELLAYVPLMAAIALVLGLTEARGTADVLRAARSRFVGLTFMVIVVGLVMRLLVSLFA
jgi:hypothetical protein